MTALDWLEIQTKTFTKWTNSKLENAGFQGNIEDLAHSMCNGVTLIQLLESISGESLGRYNLAPKLRVQCAENVNLALKYIKSKNVLITNIGAEDIMDANLKLILGLLWTLILRFTIADIYEEGLSAKDGLLLWCQRKTAGYRHCDITNFTSSWRNGLGFCALLHKHRPDLIDYSLLSPDNPKHNLQLAFKIAKEQIGIPSLLEVSDILDTLVPDEKSIMTYVAQYFHAFSAQDKAQISGRRIEQFTEAIMSLYQMQDDYEKRTFNLIREIVTIEEYWKNLEPSEDYEVAKQLLIDFNDFKSSIKREWLSEKMYLKNLYSTICTKAKPLPILPYVAPQECSISALESAWQSLVQSEAHHSIKLNAQIRESKEKLRKQFAEKANDFATMLNTLTSESGSLDGSVESQLHRVSYLLEHFNPLESELRLLEDLQSKCMKAKIEENDHTVHSFEDLKYELELARKIITEKREFLESQRKLLDKKSSVSTEQLQDITQCFRHFDREKQNHLRREDFQIALASLGLIYDSEDFEDIFLHTSSNGESVSYEQFLAFVLQETQEYSTPEQVILAFRDAAEGKPYITETDLRRSLNQEDMIQFLINVLKPYKIMDDNQQVIAEDNKEDKAQAEEYESCYDYIAWMKNLLAFN